MNGVFHFQETQIALQLALNDSPITISEMVDLHVGMNELQTERGRPRPQLLVDTVAPSDSRIARKEARVGHNPLHLGWPVGAAERIHVEHEWLPVELIEQGRQP